MAIVPPFHRQGNCVPSATIGWSDFFCLTVFERPFGQFSGHADTPRLSFRRAVDVPGHRWSGAWSQVIDRLCHVNRKGTWRSRMWTPLKLGESRSTRQRQPTGTPGRRGSDFIKRVWRTCLGPPSPTCLRRSDLPSVRLREAGAPASRRQGLRPTLLSLSAFGCQSPGGLPPEAGGVGWRREGDSNPRYGC